MTPEHQQTIFDTCPKLFSDRSATKYSRWRAGVILSRPIKSGIEAPDGWFVPIFELCKKLEYLISNIPTDRRKEISVEQIKEKFGELRFYMSFQTYEMTTEIYKCAIICSDTCQFCGANGCSQLLRGLAPELAGLSPSEF